MGWISSESLPGLPRESEAFMDGLNAFKICRFSLPEDGGSSMTRGCESENYTRIITLQG